jgi:hypothetical protein
LIKLENVSVYNWMNAIRGMRNSWGSWDKMDSVEVIAYEDLKPYTKFEMGIEDHKLAMKLAKAGSEHAKYLRQIMISVDITAPLKWWDEVDTYHFFETNSTSAMHTLGKEYITPDAFSFEDLDDDILDGYMQIINVARTRWENSGKKKPSREWRQMVMLTAMGFNYKRTFTSNYSQLRNMYFQRKNHRLQEWREFASWIETLPYSELITLKEKQHETK